MNMLEAILAILNSPLGQASANASQFTDLALNLKQVSNDELMAELERQNKEYLEKILAKLEAKE